MPVVYKRCVSKVTRKTGSKSRAHAICTAADAGGIKKYRRKRRNNRKGK